MTQRAAPAGSPARTRRWPALPACQALPAWSALPALLALVLVALNLRPAIASVGPVALDVQADLGWDAVRTGLVTTATVVTMGLAASLVPAVAHRLGRDRAIVVAMVLLVGTLAARLLAGWGWLLVLTAVVAGVAIALVSGLVPGVIRDRFRRRIGAATGIYTAAMMSGAALAGALTVPLQQLLGSWQRALASWSLLAVVGVAAWAVWSRRSSRSPSRPDPGVTAAEPTAAPAHAPMPWRHPHAWMLTAYLGLNSFVFYSLLAWLPASYEERGWTQGQAGLYLGVFSLLQVPAALLLPPFSDRLLDRRPLYAGCVVLVGGSLALVAVAPGVAPLAVLALLGIGLGGGFALGLVLLADWAPDAAAAARLTGVAFTVTYLLGALGPLAVGWVAQTTGSWVTALLVVAAAGALQLLAVPALRRGVLIH